MDLNHARLPIPPRWQKYWATALAGHLSGKNHYSTVCRGLLPSLACERGGHGDVGLEQFRHWASALRIFRRLLEGSLIGVGYTANDIQMNRSDRPAGVEFFHG